MGVAAADGSLERRLGILICDQQSFPCWWEREHECLSSGCYNKTPRTGWLKQHLFLTVLEAGKSKIKVPVNWVSGEGLPPGLQTAAFLLYLHMVEREEALVSSSYKSTNPIMGALPL